MGNGVDSQRQLVADVSHELVVQFAPEELPLFDSLLDEYFTDPTPPAQQAPVRDDPLGFGLDGTLMAVAPAAAAMVTAVLQFLIYEVAKDYLKDQAKDALKDRLASLFKSQGPESLNPDQLKQVRRVAIQRAVDFGVEARQAELMADAMIGSLALQRR